MKINNISLKNEGYVYCKSCFYAAQDILSNNSCYSFVQGTNKLIGEIDSGNWAVSYLLSMYQHRPKDFVLFEPIEVIIDDTVTSLNELAKYSCYMDRLYPLFSDTNSTVCDLIVQGLAHSKLNCTYYDVINLFQIDNKRIERPLTGLGNEIFKAFAAVGFSYGNEIFCFPWMSLRRFENYHKNLTNLIETLESVNKIVILPVGNDS